MPHDASFEPAVPGLPAGPPAGTSPAAPSRRPATEQSKVAYFGDFAVYLAVLAVLPWQLFRLAPPAVHAGLGLALLCGLGAWTLVEYAMHRLVFHGIEPFQRLHGEHHRRPLARIATPTALSLAMIACLVWLPATLLTDRWFGAAVALGLTAGYFYDGVVHHALHHRRARSAWMRSRQRMHAIHHRRPQANYGVTMPWWDHVFRSLRQP